MMFSPELKKSFLSIIRLGIGHSAYFLPKEVDWNAIEALAARQGLSAVILDGIDKLNTNLTNNTNAIPLELKLEWIGEVLQEYEQRYSEYKKAIGSLAVFYNQHGFKMMVLKGYGLSLNYPKPNHRPCGDIDVWLFGQQKEADAALLNENDNHNDNRIEIDNSHHHHSVFEWEGFTVENHYDFLNVHHHKSNVEMEAILKDLASDTSKVNSVELIVEKQQEDAGKEEDTVTVYLPSANLHALFLLRHSMSNFASTGMQLRQLLDWAFLVEKHGKEIDLKWLEDVLEKYGMKKLYDIFNAICIDDLGFSPSIFNKVQFLPSMKDRVLNDILSPEFSEKEEGGFLRRAVYKYRRWRANAWKHELCFKESMWSAFWSGVWGHLLKPSSI